MSDYHFPVYKGLQKPLEFMGIRGRFITLAAISIGVSFLAFLFFSAVFDQMVGLIVTAILIIFFLVTIYIKQKQGLHAKKKFRGIIIYKNLFIH